MSSEGLRFSDQVWIECRQSEEMSTTISTSGVLDQFQFDFSKYMRTKGRTQKMERDTRRIECAINIASGHIHFSCEAGRCRCCRHFILFDSRVIYVLWSRNWFYFCTFYPLLLLLLFHSLAFLASCLLVYVIYSPEPFVVFFFFLFGLGVVSIRMRLRAHVIYCGSTYSMYQQTCKQRHERTRKLSRFKFMRWVTAQSFTEKLAF